MGHFEDLAAFLHEYPFGECGTKTPATRATHQEEEPPDASLSWQDQIIQDVKELFGGKAVQNHRVIRKIWGRQRHVLRARPEAEGFSEMAEDAAL
jgi:hypothetical protein